MGTRGPVPKSSESRQRRNKPATVSPTSSSNRVTPIRVTNKGKLVWPTAPEDWHPIARRMWASLRESGQSRYYQPSDVALAFSLCEDMSEYKNAPKRSGQMLTAIMAGFTTLLVAEGDRRRVQLELSAEDTGQTDETPGIAEVQKWANVFTIQPPSGGETKTS